MSSKVIWSSPSIDRSRNISTAKQLNDVSIQSLKMQIIFFLLIISEICLNILLKVFGGANISIYMYTLICKTLLVINLVFIISYVYQILQARYRIYLETRDNKTQSILLSLIFDLLPQIKFYYEKVIKCKWLSPWLQKEAMERERIRQRAEEERHKILYKMYLPSMRSQYSNYGDGLMKRELFVSPGNMNANNNSGFQDSFYRNTADTSFVFRDSFEAVKTSTPYSRQRAGSPPQSPMQISTDPRHYVSDNWHHSPPHKYQQSSPSPHNSSMRNQHHVNTHNQLVSPMTPTQSLLHLGVDTTHIDQYTLHFRQWIHGTILTRVITEIDRINAHLSTLSTGAGTDEVQIGTSTIQSLRHLSLTHHQSTLPPTLSVLIDFIDCCKDQPYLINRLRELSQGRSLTKYQWDGGSTSARHPWREHLPNDAAIVLHLLNTYVDSRIHRQLHGTRSFSQQFVIDSVENKDMGDFKDTCVLLQSVVQPPHFKIVFDQAVYDMTPGRKNLFECLIVFFHKVYKNEGNLKWLNLGRSGLNLNWIFDEAD